MTDVTAVIVDDSATDLGYADRLTRDGLRCIGLEPPETTEDLRRDIERLAKAGDCDILLLDYRLDGEKLTSGDRRNYRGGSAAAVIKERLPDIPVVLVTTEAKYRANLKNKPDVQHLFDHTVLKSDLASRHVRRRVAMELADLAVGYRRIRLDEEAGWRRVTNALNAHEDAAAIEQLPVAAEPTTAAETARWIIADLLAFPGPLVDEADACALLGVTGSAFRRAELSTAIDGARYDGVFSSWHPRWWRGRLQRWLSDIADGRSGLEGSERARVIARHLGLAGGGIRPASCVWCGRANVATACSICRQAVDPTHGLRAALDNRPSWSDPAYVCFQCIQLGRDTEARIQPAAAPIVHSIRSGKLVPEA